MLQCRREGERRRLVLVIQLWHWQIRLREGIVPQELVRLCQGVEGSLHCFGDEGDLVCPC